MIKILQLNCRGYHTIRHLIAEVLRAEDPDVVLLNHTGIPTPTRPIKHYGYTTRTTSETRFDGTAILVKTHIRHDFLTSWLSPHFLAIKIHTQHDPILIATTYTRPNAGIPYADINTMFNYNIPAYLIADLNAQHTAFHHNKCNNHGRQIHQILDRKRLRFLGPDFHTCFTHNGTGRPDLAFTNRQSTHLHHHLSPGQLCGSDHIPLIIRISTNPIAIPSPPLFNYTRVDWDAFRETLDSEHTQIPLENRHHTIIDTYIDNIHNEITRAASQHIPKTQHKIYHDFRPSIRTQRLTICYRTRFERHKQHHLRIQRDLQTLRQHIINSLLADHSTHWQRILEKTQNHRTSNPSQFWKQIHKLRGTSKTPFQHLRVNNTNITDPQLVTNAFKQHWEHVFQPHRPPQHGPTTTHINAITDHMLHVQENTQPLNTIHTNILQPDHILTTPFEADDVERLLKRTPRRAPGSTGITWAMARQLPSRLISSLTTIYNASLATGYFPKAFKTATTIFIHKPNKSPHLPENYRPISLLELLGKTYERLLNARLRLYLDSNDLLSPKQYGFRQHHSTEDALNIITAYLRINKPYYKCAIVTKDVKQAFDTVWHTGLKYKICNNFDFPPITQRLLCNFLTDRQMRIRHKNFFSTFFTPLAGVPQGSVLSPTLYNMYTHDLPDPIHPESLTIQYADDVTQLTRARQLDTLTDRLQTELTATSLWELKWRIQSHPDKTAVTYFNIKRDVPRQIFLYPFILNPTPIQRHLTNKVLGLIFDNNLSFHRQVTSKVAMAKTTLSNLERFRDSSPQTKLHLYKALILPLLTYCPLALSLTAKTNHLKLQTIQNRALRFALGVKWYDFKTAQSLHRDTDLPPLNLTLHHRIMKQLEKFRAIHEATYAFIEDLNTRNRIVHQHNILDTETHIPPDPIYTS